MNPSYNSILYTFLYNACVVLIRRVFIFFITVQNIYFEDCFQMYQLRTHTLFSLLITFKFERPCDILN